MSKTKLLPYQLQSVRQIDQWNGRCPIALEMGLGKTVVRLWWAKYFKETPGPVVVVCPAYLKWVWRREAKQHVGWNATLLFKSRPPDKIPAALLNKKLYVVNYDILGPTKRGPGWVDFLRAQKPSLVIADEAQAVKDRRAARSKALKSLIKGVPHFLPLSGTPLVNRPAELWFILNLLNPKIFPTFTSYGDRFCNPQWTNYGLQYKGATRLPELHKILKEQFGMIRYRKVDVLKDLPPKVSTVLPVPIEDRKQYNEAVESFLKWLAKIDPGKARRASYAQRVTQMGYLIRLAAQLKLKPVIEWVQAYLDQGGKLLLFATHKHVIDTLVQTFDAIALKVDGSITGQKRDDTFQQFNKDKHKRLLVGNIQAAGTGWSCTATSDVGMVELPWQPGLLRQCTDRVHGLKRGKEGVGVNIYYFVAEHTIETYLAQLLDEKARTLDSVLDGKKGRDEANILDLLEKELLRGKRR